MLTLLACTDYNLTGDDKPKEADSPAPEEDTDTGSTDTDTDTGTPVETAVDTQDSGTATEPVYISTGSTLYSYDPATNTPTKVADYEDGGVPLTTMTDIAIDLGGHMYGCAFEELYAIDAVTAVVTRVATMDQSFNALTFLSDGRLVGAADDDVLYVDTSTGRTSKLAIDTPFVTSGDVVGLPDGLLYWTVESGDDLVVVDPKSGKASHVGVIGVENLFGVGYANGELYGFSSKGKAVTIDPATGSATIVQDLAGAWWGATTNPVTW